jgi:nucleotide-binding universal stress UspA family protein
LVFSYKKILLPYDGSKPSANALQQAIHIVNDLFACRRGTTNSMQGEESFEIILLHVVEEIHVRFPNMYIGLRMLAGKPLKVFFKEVYEEMRNEASKMLEDTKKRLESAIKIDRDNKSKVLSLSVTVISQVVIGNPAQVIIDVANNKQKVDLIIMGSTGLRGFSKVRALGSVSRHVCENANCPVMLVH